MMSTGIFFRNSFEPIFFGKTPGKRMFACFTRIRRFSFFGFNSYELFSIDIFRPFRVIFPFLSGAGTIDKCFDRSYDRTRHFGKTV